MKKATIILGLMISHLGFSQVTDTGNNVGIGETNPTEKLVVNGNIETRYSSGMIGFNVGDSFTYQSGSVAHYGMSKTTNSVNLSGYYGIDFHSSGIARMRVAQNGYVGVGTTNPLEKFQIGSAFTFHDGGHKVLGFAYVPSGGIDLSSSQYAAELRFDPTLGNLRLGTSSSLTNAPTSHLFITKEGRIGLGTATPDEKLHVIGTGKFGNGSVTPLTLISSTGSRSINLHSNDDVKRGELGWNTGSYFLRNASDNKLFEVHFSSGKVGINNASLNYELNIHDNGSGSVDSRIQLTNTDTGKTGGDGFQMIMNGSTNNYKVNLLNRENSDMGFWTNNTERVTISNTGNVGIGTTDTKGFKLGVNGKIAATEVKVATYANWADFVFKDSYKLPTLKEVEQHIKENGHLKDIPSAEEVKKDGIYLGEMDSKLLQKIEELTLYTIEQQKQIETQYSKIEKLEKENSELQSLSNRLDEIEQLLSNKTNKTQN